MNLVKVDGQEGYEACCGCIYVYLPEFSAFRPWRKNCIVDHSEVENI